MAISWSYSPKPPVAGSSMTISVQSAPSTPVTVTIRIGETTIPLSIQSVPGNVSFDVPGGNAGQTMTIELVSGSETTTASTPIG